MRPLWVASTASWDSGPTTPTTSSASLRAATCASSAPRAAEVAELHATTRSFAPRPSSSSAICSAKPWSSAAERSPYGNRAVSPRYRKSSCGSDTSSSCRTVRPPTPESKTAIGRSRNGSPATRPYSHALTSSVHCVQGSLQLLEDRLADLPAADVRALRGGDDAGEDDCDEQDQADVLHRALPGLASAQPRQRGVCTAHHAVPHGDLPRIVVCLASESRGTRVTRPDATATKARSGRSDSQQPAGTRAGGQGYTRPPGRPGRRFSRAPNHHHDRSRPTQHRAGRAPEAQDWCLECGAAATTRILRPPSWKLAAAIVVGVVAAVVVAVVIAVNALSGDADRAVATPARAPATTTPSKPAQAAPASTAATTPSPASAPAAGGAIASWPHGKGRWTLVLAATSS